jgi:putative PEP-CTERM system histidine kinase
MHDMKNLISQQSLVVQNARKHKDNPEFIDDAVSTIESGVVRMRGVIEQLQQTSSQLSVEKVELGKVVLRAASRCADRDPQPKVNVGDHQVWVLSEPDRLLMALVHTIRNAQDATPADGQVSVELRVAEKECAIEVRDTGRGMDADFIRDRLFRPFDSTKGTQGMGIGAYQVRETIRASGGRVEVESDVGKGTLIRILLPRTN